MVHYVLGRDSELTSLKPPKKMYKLIYKSIADTYYEYVMSMQRGEGASDSEAVAADDTAVVTSDTSEQHSEAADTAHMTEEQLRVYYHMYTEYYQQYYAAMEAVTVDSAVSEPSTVVPAEVQQSVVIPDEVNQAPPEEPSPFPELDALIGAAKLNAKTDMEQSASNAENTQSAYYQSVIEQAAALEHAYAAASIEQEEPPRMSTWLGAYSSDQWRV